MHTQDCNCPKCRLSREKGCAESGFSGYEVGLNETCLESPFTDTEELQLAAELLSVSSDEELDLFLGKLLKGAWRGVKKVGRVVGKIAKPLGGVLRTVAKTALPFVGGALGSFIPIPGVGTALGSALGGALGKALEAELGDLSPDERDFEMARRFVRMAGTAARQVAVAPPDAEEMELVETAVLDAAREQAPGLARVAGPSAAVGRRARTGRWMRRGNRILVLGA